ncbi:MAG: sigma-70 family RNA polymerase sigma factor [Clostridia bacterium]|nr:sigma-70 family RNA polymerase sigma factor [Clostridia bacterium]
MGADAFLLALQRLRQGDRAAEAELMEQNLPLVAAIVRRYQNCGLDREDAMQLGSIGLLQALRRFEPERGLCFSTYAVPLIAGEIKRFLRDDGTVKFSRESKSLALKIERIRREQGDLTVEELVRRLGVTGEEVAAALASRESIASLDAAVDEDGATLGELLKDGADTEQLALQRAGLSQMFLLLDKREQQVLYQRYFLDKTQEEVGRRLGLSQVQISRIEKKALLKMRATGTEG